MEYDFAPLEEMAEDLATKLKSKPELKLECVHEKRRLFEL